MRGARRSNAQGSPLCHLQLYLRIPSFRRPAAPRSRLVHRHVMVRFWDNVVLCHVTRPRRTRPFRDPCTARSEWVPRGPVRVATWWCYSLTPDSPSDHRSTLITRPNGGGGRQTRPRPSGRELNRWRFTAAVCRRRRAGRRAVRVGSRAREKVTERKDGFESAIKRGTS